MQKNICHPQYSNKSHFSNTYFNTIVPINKVFMHKLVTFALLLKL